MLEDNVEEREDSARRYREAAESYLGGLEVEAAGVFQRPDPMFGTWLESALGWLNDRVEGRLGRLRGSFLLAVTQDRLHAFSYKNWGAGFQIKAEIASFDRAEVRLRSYAGGELFYLSVTERGRSREIDLDGEFVATNPGAAEVVAALSG